MRKTKVTIVGLGDIGSGVAKALAKNKSFLIVGYDVRAQALDGLADLVLSAPTPAAASHDAHVVLIAVMNDAQTRDVLVGKNGILSAGALPRAVVILSTVALETVLWAANESAARGVALLDCGVSGGPQALREASITSMVGGDDDAFDMVRSVLEGFSNPVVHCGKLGNGMRAKLARNLIIYTDWMVAWEGARLAVAAGVPRDKFVEVVTASDKWVRPHMEWVNRGFGLPGTPEPTTDAGGRVAQYADKDLQAALALGAELGVDLPAAELALRRFRAVVGLD
jgi:3-hydroxyisobutyrate dehydrogenase-like beta-hydroxyacid dehydrogenase